MSLLELYTQTPYEPLIPTSSDSSKNIFKFNSIQHFISYIGELDARFKRGSIEQASEKESSQFSFSKSLADAYEVIRQYKFNSDDNSFLERKISEIRKGTIYSEEGYEIDVAEHLAGSDKTWLQDKKKKTPTRIINDILFLDAGYNAMVNAEDARKTGMKILSSIYKRRVIPRKIVVTINPMRLRGNSSEPNYACVDVSFSDLNGIAKMLHPSTFRRLWFRLAEIYPDLTSGYGSSKTPSTTKGMISLQYMLHKDEKDFESNIDVFLGITKK